ncbi:MAG: TorF family putative porin [Betaproteobacteria bacterium]|nr:TorF family putative porin [Betaproteobacteria bacterium]MDE2048291.1 TorF family putative porin [Betaproteobacteria bacterium]
MNKTLLSLALACSALAPMVAQAADPDYTLAYNVGLTTDYRYRGITQSRFDPALSGGIDFTHKSGFYLGTWLSTIKWIKDAGTISGVDTGNANLEWDLYGGYKGSITKDLGYDVGILSYVYPGNKYGNIPGGADANTTEIYGALSYNVFTLKYSHAVTNLFGFGSSTNSGYIDLSASFDLGNGWSVAPHVGHQKIKNNGAFDYTDYSLTVGKDFGNGFSVALAAIGTNADKTLYVDPNGKFTGKSTAVLSAKYTF